MSNGHNECVKWNQLSPCLAAVFLGNAVFSLVLVIVVTSQGSTTQTQTIHIDADHERAALIEKLTRENLKDGRLLSTTGGIQRGSD